MGKKILVSCLDVIMIAFFPEKYQEPITSAPANIQSKTIFQILN